MRTVVSSSLFGFVTVAALALAGCNFSTEADGPADPPDVTGQDGSNPADAIGVAKPELGPAAFGSGTETVIGVAKPELAPVATSPAGLVEVERAAPVLELTDGKPGVPTAIGIAPELAPVGSLPSVPAEVAGGCSSDADCGTPECYNGMQESFFCDAAGMCQVQIDSCGAYACGDTACLTDCRSDADCAEGAHCDGSRCN